MKALLVLLMAGAALAGCGAAPDLEEPPQDAEGRYVIEMQAGNHFHPMKAKVPVGATVLWKVAVGQHDVVADDGSFQSPLLGPGETFENTFDSAGTVKYHCRPHEAVGMKGTLQVG